MEENKKDYFEEADERLLLKLRETAAFLQPLNKKLSERIVKAEAEAERNFSEGKRNDSVEALRALICGEDGLDGTFVSHIVKREQYAVLKSELKQLFSKVWIA